MSGAPALRVRNASLSFGSRTLWSELNLHLAEGEFLAVLGANGSGKTSLIKAILGLLPLSAGDIAVAGAAARRGNDRVGYIPQERRLRPPTPLRARDLVRLGIDGHRWGVGVRRRQRCRVDQALDDVQATHLSTVDVGEMSGGEQQRIRIAQALVTDPQLLICDEPLLSLDLRHQQVVVGLIDRRRRERRTAVIFVTHEINPVLPYVDRVLYLADGAFRTGTVDEVMTSATLSALYRSPVEVVRSAGRLLVAGVPESRVDPAPVAGISR